MAEQVSKSTKDISSELASKLERRPSAKEAGVDNKLAPKLQATAKKLESQQKKHIVNRKLKHRPSAKEAGVDDKIAAAIQPTAKALSNRIRRDSLKHSLESRPDVTELVDSGILKSYSQTLAKSLQLDAAKLEAALASQVSQDYLKQIGVLDPYKKNVDSTNIDIEAASGLLLRALVYRPTSETAMHEKGGTQFGFSNVAASLQSTAKHLDVQRKKDILSSALRDRPSPQDVMDQNVTQMGYDVNVAPSLQQSIKDLGREMIKDTLGQFFKKNSPTTARGRRRSSSFDAEQLAPRLQAMANKLAMEQKKDILKEQLNQRPHARSLIRKGILRPYASSLAARLQLNADILEQQLAIRVNEERLKEMGILEPYKKHVDTTSINAMDVESKANLILKSLVKQRQRRESGGDKHNEIAATLAATAKQLKLKQTKDTLKRKLETQPNREDVRARAPSLDDSVAPSLQATKKKLETAQKADIVSKTLQRRQEPQDVGIDMKISPAIQAIAKSLASKIRRDSLGVLIAARPDVLDVIDSGILKPYSLRLAQSLQLDAATLEQALAAQVSKDYLKEIGVLEPEKKYVDRASIDIEAVSGMLLRALVLRARPSLKKVVSEQGAVFGFSDIAPMLQQTAKNLDRQQKKDKLSAALEKRPTAKGVMEKQATQLGYDVNAAPSLQQTIKDLGREMVKNALEKALRVRPSADVIGVDVKSAPKIQSAMHDLNMAQKRDSVSKSMKRRPSAEEVGVDTRLARGLQRIAKDLEMEMKTDKVAHSLGDLGIIKKTKTESVIARIDECIDFLSNYGK